MLDSLSSTMSLLLPRGLSDAPPPPRNLRTNHATLLVSWWCTAFALVIILMRVIGRFIRSERLFREDAIMLWSIVPLLARMALAHLVLIWGTNNVASATLSAQSIIHRTRGSKIVLACRILYAMFIWSTKWSASEYLKRLTYATWNPTSERILTAIRWFLAITFVGVIIGTLAECQPFDHYWQVRPDPGAKCRNGYAQLLVMGTSDMITDLLLIIFPIPIIFRSSMTYGRKISLSLLFMLSIFLIAITAVKMESVIHLDGLQQRRTLWASIEILAAAAVTNTLVLGSFVRDRGTKKTKFRPSDSNRLNSEPEGPSINRQMTLQHWGGDSDEDLFRSIGSRLNSSADFMAAEQNPPRPAPRVSDGVHARTKIQRTISENSDEDDDIETVPVQQENLRPQAYAAFLRVLDEGPPPDLASKASLRLKTPPSLHPIQSPNLTARQDFESVDWHRFTSPEELHISDAGGLLPGPATPTRDDPNQIRRGTNVSAEVSPLNLRPRTWFPDLARPPRRSSSRTRPLSDLLSPSRVSLSGRLSRDMQRPGLASIRAGSERSLSRSRPSPGLNSGQGPGQGGQGFDDMMLSDAGGLLT